MAWKKFYIYLLIALLPSSIFLSAQTATTTDLLQSKIDERNAQIKQLEDEINQYNLEISNADSQARTLQGTLKSLDLTQKKITTDINLTGKKIDNANLTIGQLGEKISADKKALISAIQNIQKLEDVGVLETILSDKNLDEVWKDIDNVKQVQDVIMIKSRELTDQQKSLITQKTSLVSLKNDLSSKQVAVQETAQEKASLLAQTKNKEQAFQNLVATKQQQRAQFEKEVTDFEEQLNLIIDTNSYPVASHGILSWPLDNPPTQSSCDSLHKVLSCIVRGFFRPTIVNGLTVSPGHNGVDFRASIGTKVKSVLDGVVAGTGNTDIYRGCYGLGKWVMVNHPNGLSTIYMHLSVISVTTGQNLKTGDTIGLSGNTGNSEAPHLHVSVYATQGVRIEQFINSIGCKQAVVPLADPKAYLDPLTYFPII